MAGNSYYIVDKSILPDYFEKVVETRRLLNGGIVKEVSAAVRMTGISRSTYYKYKDFVFEPEESSNERKAVFFMLLSHEKGVLSGVLTEFSAYDANIIAITQSPPISGKASVILTLDISRLTCEVSMLTQKAAEIKGVEQVKLVNME